MSMILFRAKITPHPDFPMRTLKDPKNKENMSLMLALYGLCMLNSCHHGLYECGYFNSGVRYSELILEAIKSVN